MIVALTALTACIGSNSITPERVEVAQKLCGPNGGFTSISNPVLEFKADNNRLKIFCVNGAYFDIDIDNYTKYLNISEGSK